MDIRKILASEHSRTSTMRIVKWIGDDPGRVRELVKVFTEGEYRLTQRAAWPLSYVFVDHPELLRPYTAKFISMLGSDIHPSVPRNILRIFAFVLVEEKYRGKLFDKCLAFVADEGQPVAVRANALAAATLIVKKHPDLFRELVALISPLMEMPLQPAMKVRIREALKAVALH